MKDNIYRFLPNFAQNVLISIFNILQYRKRYGREYFRKLELFKANQDLTYEELLSFQKKRYSAFLNDSRRNSKYYQNLLSEIPNSEELKNIKNLPILTKENIRSNLNNIYTIDKNSAIISKTGGTTGKSLEVLFTQEDMQERFAMLDNFRSEFGYKLGKKTAWFSGKNLLTKRDVRKNRFWKTDFFYNVRYFSTFHIKDENLQYYVSNLIKFKPEYLVGFPSTMAEIANFGLRNEISFPKDVVKAVFTTAESLTKEMRESIEAFFETKIYNQYASSEGAPFIFECVNGNLHLEMQSGIFEVLDNNNEDVSRGRLVVTSFTTNGTPLIRYDIGDDIALSNNKCQCRNNNPLVEEISGRIDDFIFSPQTGKINLGNISNCLKDVYGIIKFQVHQNSLDELVILIVRDEEVFDDKNERKFIQNFRDRVGNIIAITIRYVENITEEKSGKYRLIKNNLKEKIIK